MVCGKAGARSTRYSPRGIGCGKTVGKLGRGSKVYCTCFSPQQYHISRKHLQSRCSTRSCIILMSVDNRNSAVHTNHAYVIIFLPNINHPHSQYVRRGAKRKKKTTLLFPTLLVRCVMVQLSVIYYLLYIICALEYLSISSHSSSKSPFRKGG